MIIMLLYCYMYLISSGLVAYRVGIASLISQTVSTQSVHTQCSLDVVQRCSAYRAGVASLYCLHSKPLVHTQ